MRKRNFIIVISLITAGIITGFNLSADLDIQQLNYAEETGISSDTPEFLVRFSNS